MGIWVKLNGQFTKFENWGEPEKVSGFLLLVMNELRLFTGWPIIIHNAYETDGHSENSQHYHGNANDFHFETEVTYRVQIDKVLEFLDEFQIGHLVGLGIYPYWTKMVKGEKVRQPGFHIDTRNTYARWAYNKQKEQVSFMQMMHRITHYEEGN